LDVTGEEDLLAMLPGNSHLLRGDPRPTLGTEVVVRGPRFIFSDGEASAPAGAPFPESPTPDVDGVFFLSALRVGEDL